MTTKIKDILEDYADLGFRLVEEADHVLVLFFKEDWIASFNQTKVKKEVIWAVCQGYLDGLNGGDNERNV